MTYIKYLLLFCFAFCAVSLSAQSISDLESRLKKATKYRDKMLIKYDLARAYLKTDADKAARYAQDAADIAYKMRNKDMQCKIYYLDGEIHLKRRDNNKAEARFKSALSIAKEADNKAIVLGSADQLAKLAYKDRDYKKAYSYAKESLSVVKKNGLSVAESSRTSGSSRNDKELVRLENENVKLTNEKSQLVQENRRLKEKLGEPVDIGLTKKALDKKEAEFEAERRKAEEEIRAREEKLAEISEARQKAEERTQRYIKRYKDLSADEQEQAYEFELKEKALLEEKLEAEQNNKRLGLIGIGASSLMLLALLGLFSNRRSRRKLQEKNKQIETERERSDELLLNILPEPIAKELKENGKAKAQKFDSASVLFTDFKNFSNISEKLSPEALVAELDHCFKAFDYIISQYDDIEKIKTIGDAYMCASGLTDRKVVPTNIVKAAMEMQDFLEDYKQDRKKKGLPFFEARIGVHTGPVVAGVVGFNKFAYDIWGDTVNTAARMESNCEPGKVNISESTYNQVRYKFTCNYRGKIAAKNKGMIDMYYVEQAL